ncbi:nitroreductase family protein [Micromonospora sp. DT81.3]|uniref:nitroreductase family protein n=1 Tax=Micromonospora sp. DT81.3 TaxID=3416523 RepID=UPI003CEDA86D
MDVDTALTSTRAFRRRLDLSRPVDRAVISECLDLAVRAPSGSDRRAWQFIAVDDPGLRVQIGGSTGAASRRTSRVAGSRHPPIWTRPATSR